VSKHPAQRIEVHSWGPREEASDAVVVRRVRRAGVLAVVGRKRVEGPSRVVQSFQSVFLLRLVLYGLGCRTERLRTLFRDGVPRDRGAKKSSSTCQRGVSYSDVGVVARRVSQ
jgi:hypothetical protein